MNNSQARPKKKCPHCQQDIDVIALVCPNCKKVLARKLYKKSLPLRKKSWFFRHKALTIPVGIIFFLIWAFFTSAIVYGGMEEITAEKETVEVREVQTVSAENINEDDPNLEKGKTKIKQTGRGGSKELVYSVTYYDGKERRRKLISDTVVEQPVPQITLVGSRVVDEPSTQEEPPKPPPEIKTATQEEKIVTNPSPEIKTVTKEETKTDKPATQQKPNESSETNSVSPSENIESSAKNVLGDKFRKSGFESGNGTVAIDFNIGDLKPDEGLSKIATANKYAFETAKRIYLDEGAAKMTRLYVYGETKDDDGKKNENTLIMEVHLSKLTTERIDNTYRDWSDIPVIADYFKEYVDIDKSAENIKSSAKNVLGDKFRKSSFDATSRTVAIDLNIGDIKPDAGVSKKVTAYKSALETAKRIYLDDGAAKMTRLYVYGEAEDDSGKNNGNTLIMEVHLSKTTAERINDNFSDWSNIPKIADYFKEYVDIDVAVAEKAKEQKYREDVEKLSNDCSKALGEIGEFLKENPIPLLWTDEEKIMLALNMSIIQIAYGDAQKFDVPAKYTEVQNLLLAGLNRYSDAMTAMAEGIDSLDVNKMNTATNLMNEGNAYINEATNKLLLL